MTSTPLPTSSRVDVEASLVGAAACSLPLLTTGSEMVPGEVEPPGAIVCAEGVGVSAAGALTVGVSVGVSVGAALVGVAVGASLDGVTLGVAVSTTVVAVSVGGTGVTVAPSGVINVGVAVGSLGGLGSRVSAGG